MDGEVEACLRVSLRERAREYHEGFRRTQFLGFGLRTYRDCVETSETAARGSIGYVELASTPLRQCMQNVTRPCTTLQRTHKHLTD